MKSLKLITLFTLCLLLKATQVFSEESSAPTPAASSNPAPPPVAVEGSKTVKITEGPVVTTANGVRVETRTIETQPLQQEKAVPQTRHFEGSSETKIENNISIDGRSPAFGAIPVAASPATAVISTVASEALTSRPLSVTPVAGVTTFQGAWYNHISNRGTVGLIVDIPILSILSLEAEAQYGRFNMSYSNYAHNFNQYSGGANAKVTLGNGLFQPYLGVGMMAVYYEGMANTGYTSNPANQMVGAGQLLAGLDVNLLGGISLGVRGELLRPMTNLAPVNGGLGSQDAAAMNSNFGRILGTVKVSF